MIAASCKSINVNFYLWAADAKGEKVKSERREWADKAGDASSTRARWRTRYEFAQTNIKVFCG